MCVTCHQHGHRCAGVFRVFKTWPFRYVWWHVWWMLVHSGIWWDDTHVEWLYVQVFEEIMYMMVCSGMHHLWTLPWRRKNNTLISWKNTMLLATLSGKAECSVAASITMYWLCLATVCVEGWYSDCVGISYLLRIILCSYFEVTNPCPSSCEVKDVTEVKQCSQG